MAPPPPGQQPFMPNIPGMPPMLPPGANGGKPMVVIMMKGGANPGMLPFMPMMGGPQQHPAGKKKKKKSKGGKKKTKKAGEKKKAAKPGEEESDSDSDRMSAPEIPNAHTHKPPPGAAGANGQPGQNDTAPPMNIINNNPISGRQGQPGGGGADNQFGQQFGQGGGTPGKSGGKAGKSVMTGVGPAPGADQAGAAGGAGGAANKDKSVMQQTAIGAAPGAPGAAAGAAGGKTPAKKPPVKKAPPKPGVKKENFIIKDGNVDKSCVPMFTIVDGPAQCPIIVPLDARDDSFTVPELGPQPLKVAPKETTKGYLVLNDDGLLYFKHHKECKEQPPNSSAGQLMKFLANSNIFVPDSGPQVPDEKNYNKDSNVTKDKIGGVIAVSGHVVMVTDKGSCKFTRVTPTQAFPFYPASAAMGVLVKDLTNGLVYFVPTENRFVGPVLSQGVRPTFKPVTEAAIVGNIYKDASGAPIWEVPSEKKENIMGYIMSSATGVPIYVPKPDDNFVRAAPPPKKNKPAVTPGATSAAASATGATGGASPAAQSPGSAANGAAGAEANNNDAAPSAAKAVASVACVALPGGSGPQSVAVPMNQNEANAAAAASGGATAADVGAGGAGAASPGTESVAAGGEDPFKKALASANSNELPPVPPPTAEEKAAAEAEAAAAAAAPAEAAAAPAAEAPKEEAPPPPPPAPAPVKSVNSEYKKFLEERSVFLGGR